jgi:integrase
VRYRLGGRESTPKYGGSFKTAREAEARQRWIAGELAAMRVPNLRLVEAKAAPTLEQAAETWRASRVDVAPTTNNTHRSDIARIFKVCPSMRRRRVDSISVDDCVSLVNAMIAHAYKKDTIKKSRDALAMVLDYAEIKPNPARDKRVRLPKEKKAHIPPPLAEHIERVAETLTPYHVLPFCIIDACGPRVNELATALVGDVDETLQAIRVRASEEKNERYRHLHVPDELFSALLDLIGPREDRVVDARIWPQLTDAQLRTAITRACKATGTPTFSPHGMRRRRGSLFYKRTGSLAEVAELLGDSKRVAADHYVYALTDYREADYSIALARARTVHTSVHTPAREKID